MTSLAAAHDSTVAERVRQQREVMDRLVGRAVELSRRGQLERAAAAAQVAAAYGWLNHPGIFASQPLERVIAGLGAALPAAARRPIEACGRARVLHVASEVYGTGGHTRMLANWISEETEHEPIVCLTSQRGRPVPADLAAAMRQRGIRPILLDESCDGLMSRAQALRDLTIGVDAVVMHVHPHDIAASVALADRRHAAAQVLYINHADHVFCAGMSVADRVVSLRATGRRLCLERRGVPEERAAVLIRPLRARRRTATREVAKERLGIPPGTRVVVTAAIATKYESVDGRGFLDLVGPMLLARDDVQLWAAGPAPEGRWAELERSGRGRALGLLPDVLPLLEAADAYVDSYPFASLTSMLEAASVGVPVVTFRAGGEPDDVLGADTPELDDVMNVASSSDDLARIVGLILDDDQWAEQLSRSTRRAVEVAHAGDAWAVAARRLVESPPPEATMASTTGDAATVVTPLDCRVALVQAQTGWGQGEAAATLMCAEFLTAVERILLCLRDPRGSDRGRRLLSSGQQRLLRACRGWWEKHRVKSGEVA